MSYIRLKKECKELQEKIPILVEQEKYEDAQKIKEYLELSKTDPREFLKMNVLDKQNNVALEDLAYNAELAFIYDTVVKMTIQAEKEQSLVGADFVDGYYYYIATFNQDPISKELNEMIEEDIGSDATDLQKVHYIMIKFIQCRIDKELDDTYYNLLERTKNHPFAKKGLIY
jgi:hypothetical protein